MPKYIIDKETLSGIGNAIRDVNGETKLYKPSEMIEAVSNIMDSATYILTDAAGNEYFAVYTDSEVVLTATASDIRQGKVAVTDSGLTTGTMIDEGGTIIPEGYVKPSGNLHITKNGSFDVTDKKSVSVNVANIPVPTDVLTEKYMTALLDTAEPGSIYRYVGGESDVYEYGALYIVEAVAR
jgi:hypothetical protein